MSPKNPVPEDANELEQMLNERDSRLGEVMHEYVAKQSEQIDAQLNEKIQAGVAEWLRDNREQGFVPRNVAAVQAMSPAKREVANRHKLFSDRAVGTMVDGHPAAATIGKFLMNVLATKSQNTDETNEFRRAFQGQFKNAMSERVPSSGGFLVPETLRSQILMVALETAVVRPRARIIPMDSLRVPYPTIDDTTHTSSVFGGVVASWTEEGAALSMSQPSFGRIVLEAKKLTGYTEIPNELLQDAVAALDQWFNEMFPIALAWFEDVAFINGDGVGQPQGFTNSPCAVTVTRAGSNLVQFADIAAMFPRMLPASLNSAVWLCSPAVIAQLLQLALVSPPGATSGTAVSPPLWLNSMSAHDGVIYTMLGRPLIVSEKMPNLGSQGDLAFVDLGYYLLGDRQTMQIANSDEFKFQNDLTAFRVIERLDGRTWIQSAITPENNGPTLSPVVLLHA